MTRSAPSPTQRPDLIAQAPPPTPWPWPADVHCAQQRSMWQKLNTKAHDRKCSPETELPLEAPPNQPQRRNGEGVDNIVLEIERLAPLSPPHSNAAAFGRGTCPHHPVGVGVGSAPTKAGLGCSQALAPHFSKVGSRPMGITARRLSAQQVGKGSVELARHQVLRVSIMRATELPPTS